MERISGFACLKQSSSGSGLNRRCKENTMVSPTTEITFSLQFPCVGHALVGDAMKISACSKYKSDTSLRFRKSKFSFHLFSFFVILNNVGASFPATCSG